jgi:hypothetical protein
MAFGSQSGVLSYHDNLHAIQTRVRPFVVLVIATHVDQLVDESLGSLFSCGPFCGSSSTLYRLGSSDDTTADRSVYFEGSSGSSGLCISLGLD